MADEKIGVKLVLVPEDFGKDIIDLQVTLLFRFDYFYEGVEISVKLLLKGIAIFEYHAAVYLYIYW